MIPVAAYLAAGALVIGAAGGLYGGWQVRDWQADADDLARVRAEQRDTLRRQEAAIGAAQTFEEMRDAIRREIMASLPRLRPALAVPVPHCPALDVGAVVVPAGALRVLRDAAGEQPADDPAEPRPAVLPGADAP